MIVEVKSNVIYIKEPIVTIIDSTEVMEKIEEIAQNSEVININLDNTFSFPSNIIGLLEKLKDEGKSIKVFVKDDIVYELFTDLGLDRLFQIIKV